MAYVSDNNWTPANGPKSGPMGPLATRNPLGMFSLGKPGAAELALLALGLGFAYWVLRPKKKPRRRHNPTRAAARRLARRNPRARKSASVRSSYHSGARAHAAGASVANKRRKVQESIRPAMRRLESQARNIALRSEYGDGWPNSRDYERAATNLLDRELRQITKSSSKRKAKLARAELKRRGR